MRRAAVILATLLAIAIPGIVAGQAFWWWWRNDQQGPSPFTGAISSMRPVTAPLSIPGSDLSTSPKYQVWPRHVYFDAGTGFNTEASAYTQEELDTIADCGALIAPLGRVLTLRGAQTAYELRQRNPDMLILGAFRLFTPPGTQPSAGGDDTEGRIERAMWNALAGADATIDLVQLPVGKPWANWRPVAVGGDSLREWNPVGPSWVQSFGDNGYDRATAVALLDSILRYPAAQWGPIGPIAHPALINGFVPDYVHEGPAGIEPLFPLLHTQADFGDDGVSDYTYPNTWAATAGGQSAKAGYHRAMLDFLRNLRSVARSNAVIVPNFSGATFQNHQDWLPPTSGVYVERFGYLASSQSFQPALEAVRTLLLSQTPSQTTHNIGWTMLGAVNGDPPVTMTDGVTVRSRPFTTYVASLILGTFAAIHMGDGTAIEDPDYFVAGYQHGPLVRTNKGGGVWQYRRAYRWDYNQDGRDDIGVARIVCRETGGSAASLDSVEFDRPVGGVPTPQPDRTLPTIAFTWPTSGPTFITTADTTTIWVAASDNRSVVDVTLSNQATDLEALATPSGSARWTTAAVALAPGDNPLSAVARDPSGNVRSAFLTVTRTGVDLTPPVLVSIDSPGGDRTYRIDELVPLTFRWSEPVVLSGPFFTARLANGPTQRTLSLNSGSGTPTLSGTYKVREGDTTADLDLAGTDALQLAGITTLTDQAGNPAILTAPVGATEGSLASNRTIVLDGSVGPPPDTTPPTWLSWDGTAQDGGYKVGANLVLIGTASEPIPGVGSNVRLLLETGATDRYATYAAQIGPAQIAMVYSPQAGDATLDLDYHDTRAFELNGSAIADTAGNPMIGASLELPAPGAPRSLGHNRNYVIDTTGPSCVRVYAITGAGPHTVGDTILVALEFNERASFGLTPPTIPLEMGATDGTATYVASQPSTVAVFRHIVLAGENSADLDIVAGGGITLGAGSIQDDLGNPASTALPQPGTSGALGVQSNVVVDTTSPLVAGLSTTLGPGTYGLNQVVPIAVNYNEVVFVTGVPRVTVATGSPASTLVNFTSGSGTASPVFEYTVAAGNTSADLDVTALALNGGSIVDAAGNAASTTIPIGGAAGSFQSNEAIVIDTSVPQTGGKRLLLTVRDTKISGAAALNRFPLLIQLSGAYHTNVFTGSLGDGTDIRVTTASDTTTALPVEVVSWNQSAKTAEIWARVNLTKTTARDFYLYYGTHGKAAPPADSTFTKYKAALHFNDTPADAVVNNSVGGVTDVTAYGSWSGSHLIGGKIGSALHYETDRGTRVTGHTMDILTPAWSVGGWLYHTTRGTDFFFMSSPCYSAVASQAHAGTPTPFVEEDACFPGQDMRKYWQPNPIALGEWHHFQWTYNGAVPEWKFYYDGQPRGIYTTWGSITPSANHFIRYNEPAEAGGEVPLGIIGPSLQNSMDMMNGYADEFRLTPVVLSADWIATEYAMQSDPDQFYTYSQAPTGGTYSDGVVLTLNGSGFGAASAYTDENCTIAPWPPQRYGTIYEDIEGAGAAALIDSIADVWDFTLEVQDGPTPGQSAAVDLMAANSRFKGFYTYLSTTDVNDGTPRDDNEDNVLHFLGPTWMTLGDSNTVVVNTPPYRMKAYSATRSIVNYGTQAARDRQRDLMVDHVNTDRDGVYPIGIGLDNSAAQKLTYNVTGGNGLVKETENLPGGPFHANSNEFITWYQTGTASSTALGDAVPNIVGGAQGFLRELVAYFNANAGSVPIFGGRSPKVMPNIAYTPYIGGPLPCATHAWMRSYIHGGPTGHILEQEFAFSPTAAPNFGMWMPSSIYNKATCAMAVGASTTQMGILGGDPVNPGTPATWNQPAQDFWATYWATRPWDGGGTSPYPTTYAMGGNLTWTPASLPGRFRATLAPLTRVDLGEPIGDAAGGPVDAWNEPTGPTWKVWRRDCECGQAIVRFHDGMSNATATIDLGRYLTPIDLWGVHEAPTRTLSVINGFGKVMLKKQSVAMANAANYELATKRQFQPASSWSGSQVTITIDWGTQFLAGESVWFFVFTEAGTVVGPVLGPVILD